MSSEKHIMKNKAIEQVKKFNKKNEGKKFKKVPILRGFKFVEI